MKKLFSVFMLIALCMSTLQASKNPSNSLRIKGKILDKHHADIMVFKYETATEGWHKIEHLLNRSNYNFELEPDANYYIMFSNQEGVDKIMCIDAGNTGIWYKQVDISFKNETKYARLYQYSKEYNLQYTTKNYFNCSSNLIEESYYYDDTNLNLSTNE